MNYPRSQTTALPQKTVTSDYGLGIYDEEMRIRTSAPATGGGYRPIRDTIPNHRLAWEKGTKLA